MSSPPTRQLSILTFWRLFTLRHARSELLQTGLLLLILGLGVGTFLSIRVANRAAMAGFRLFTETVRGSSDWIIQGIGDGIPLEELTAIRRLLGSLPADLYPVVETVLRPGEGPPNTPPKESARLLGLDLVQIRELAQRISAIEDGDFWESIRDPEHILIGKELAQAWNVETGEKITLIIKAQPKSFTVRGILPQERGDGTPIPQNMALIDLASLAQRMPDLRLDRIEIVIPQGPLRNETLENVKHRLKDKYGATYKITSPEMEALQGQSMTAAFRLNLTVLSLIALLVGIYLIAQTLDATVSRRRLEIATLRSLGIDPRAIYRLWLSEALLYGTLAGMAGILIGWGLSTVTIGAVSTTVRALYRDTVESAATISFSDIQLSFALAIIGSFLAAWLPARDAAETPPAQFLRIGKRIPPFSLFNHYWVGLISVVLGAALLTLPAWPASPTLNIPLGGYASAFLWLTGGTLLVVRLLKIVGTALHAIWPDSPSVRLASGRLIHPTSRHQLALAGFYVAIGMASAMSFLIGSFQHTVTSWLEHRLRADLFLSTVGFQGSEADERMPAFILDEIEADPAVEAMDRFRLISIELKNLTVGLAGSRFELLGDRQDLLWIQTPSADLRPAPNSTAGYANENLARRANLKIGDVLTINTPQGDKRITILGIHADYARDNGLLLIDLSRLIEWFGIDDFDTASVFLKDGTSILNAKEALRNRFPGLAVRDNPELKKTALSIFAQTFAVTKALQLIGIIVALSGLILSLVSLLRESDRELSLQKTLGMTRHQIAKATAVEGLGIALCGLIGGIFLSIALGYVMIFVINRQSFGWTLQSAYPVAATSLLAALILLLSWAISYATGSLFLRKWKPQSL